MTSEACNATFFAGTSLALVSAVAGTASDMTLACEIDDPSEEMRWMP
jgi:hypothetical protein